MEFKAIASIAELTEFDERITQMTSVKFPMAYWQHCQVIGCHNSEQKLIGGYALVLEPPFRSLMVLSKVPEAYEQFCRAVPLDRLAEVTGLWAESKVMSRHDRVKFGQTMVRALYECDRDYFLYVYNLDRPYLQKLYARTNPKVLFRGLLPGAMPNSFPVGIEYFGLDDLKQLMQSDRFMQAA